MMSAKITLSEHALSELLESTNLKRDIFFLIHSIKVCGKTANGLEIQGSDISRLRVHVSGGRSML
jgi:hypothetical protein